MIKLVNISKNYNKGKREVQVLKSISCIINSGEMVALMGRSGSGKTNLINILSGLLNQSGGEYLFNSEDLSQYTISQRDSFREKNIGIIVQNYSLFNSLTAFDNIIVPLKLRKIKPDKSKQQIEEISKNLGIIDCLHKKVYNLSGGECQRVAIARALVKRPTLILADEPTGSLDSKTEQDVMDIFNKLKNEGNTIIIATHSELVANCCDRVLKIDDGELV